MERDCLNCGTPLGPDDNDVCDECLWHYELVMEDRMELLP